MALGLQIFAYAALSMSQLVSFGKHKKSFESLRVLLPKKPVNGKVLRVSSAHDLQSVEPSQQNTKRQAAISKLDAIYQDQIADRWDMAGVNNPIQLPAAVSPPSLMHAGCFSLCLELLTTSCLNLQIKIPKLCLQAPDSAAARLQSHIVKPEEYDARQQSPNLFVVVALHMIIRALCL